MKKNTIPKFYICSPVYNDWDSAIKLLADIDETIHTEGIDAALLFVDDGSTQQIPVKLQKKLAGLRKVEILRLRRNLGHQRAIAVGLTYINTNLNCDAVIVMDSDGEDLASDIPKLINRLKELKNSRVVFAKRQRRTASFLFKFFYFIYKVLHRVLTGCKVEVGNFSIIPSDCLDSLVSVSDLWNHYAASVFQSKISVDAIPIDRGQRIAGKSRMNFISLVMHGLSAISVYSDIVSVRLFVALAGMMGISVSLIIFIGTIYIFTDRSIPGLMTASIGILTIILLQLMALSVTFVFVTLQSRNSLTFLPLRDFQYFISYVEEIKFSD